MNKTLSGTTRKFSGNGRGLGYPTANFTAETDAKDGVYISFSTLKFNELKYDSLPSLTFIGIPTTVGDTERRVEVHFLDIPDMDYYGAKVSTQLVHKIRDNLTLDSIDQLVELMQKDEAQARAYFKDHKI